jgi:prepilin-type processing-associated H-X9-DG protein
MNRYFMWKTMNSVMGDVSDASKLLLFAELPAQTIKTSSSDADGALETKDNGGSTAEFIGFNHSVGKRYVAHVAYADGHVDGLLEPTGESESDMKETDGLLCNGDDISDTLLSKIADERIGWIVFGMVASEFYGVGP